MAVLVDENVGRPDIADLFIFLVHLLSGLEESIHKIPQLWLFEVLVLHLAAVDDLIAEKIRVVLVVDLGKGWSTLQRPLEPQNWVLLN